MKQKLVELKEEIDKSTIIIGELNIPFSTTNNLLNRNSARI